MKNINYDTAIKVLLAVFLLVILVVIPDKCSRASREYDLQQAQIESTMAFNKQRLRDSSTIYSQKQQIVDAYELAEIFKERLAEMISIKERVTFNTKTNTRAEVKLADPVPGREAVDTSLYIKLPLAFHKKGKWYSLDGRLTRTGFLLVDSLTTFARLTYEVGDTIRSGFFYRVFKRKDPIVRLHIDNPSMSISGMQNIYVSKKRLWYQTTLFKITAGMLAGAILVNVSAKK